MTPGPNYIYECPNCGSFLKRGSINSGNNFISTLYSDGNTIAPMLPKFPDLTKCGKCNAILWLSEMTEIGTCEEVEEREINCKTRREYIEELFSKGLLSPTDYVRHLELDTVEEQKAECNPEWKNAIWVFFWDVHDLFRFLEWDTVKNDIEKEKYVRTNIWWTFNNRIRTSKGNILSYQYSQKLGNILSSKHSEVKLWKKNCLRLIELLDKTEINQKIMAAELYRNLGNFKNCIELLTSIKDNNYDWIVEKMKLECENKNSMLIVLQ